MFFQLFIKILQILPNYLLFHKYFPYPKSQPRSKYIIYVTQTLIAAEFLITSTIYIFDFAWYSIHYCLLKTYREVRRFCLMTKSVKHDKSYLLLVLLQQVQRCQEARENTLLFWKHFPLPEQNRIEQNKTIFFNFKRLTKFTFETPHRYNIKTTINVKIESVFLMKIVSNQKLMKYYVRACLVENKITKNTTEFVNCLAVRYVRVY